MYRHETIESGNEYLFCDRKKKKKKKKKRKDKIENNNFVRDSSVCEIENGSKNKGKNKFLNWK